MIFLYFPHGTVLDKAQLNYMKPWRGKQKHLTAEEACEKASWYFMDLEL